MLGLFLERILCGTLCADLNVSHILAYGRRFGNSLIQGLISQEILNVILNAILNAVLNKSCPGPAAWQELPEVAGAMGQGGAGVRSREKAHCFLMRYFWFLLLGLSGCFISTRPSLIAGRR